MTGVQTCALPIRRSGVEPSGGGFRWRFPPSIFSGGSLLSLCFWFCVSPPPPLENPRGAIFIVGFRSRRSHGDEDRWQQSLEGPDEWSHAARYRGRMGHPLLALRPPFACILRSEVFFLPKNDPRKFSAHYDVVKDLKQIRKEIRVFCLRMINSIKRGNHY